jgi:hypothetical protein
MGSPKAVVKPAMYRTGEDEFRQSHLFNPAEALKYFAINGI